MKKLTITSIITAAVCALSLQAENYDQRGQKSQTSPQDSSFIKQAAQGNLAEVQLGKLGAKKSQNDQVKQLSQHLQKDHQKSNDQLKELSQRKGLDFPKTVDSKRQQDLDRLEKLSGAEFDKQFITTAIKEHARTAAKEVGVNESEISSILRQYPEAMGAPGTATGRDEGAGRSKSGKDYEKEKHEDKHMHDQQD